MKNRKKINWDNYPKNTFGWFLWAIPRFLWKPTIIIVALSILYTGYQITRKRDLEINEAIKENKIKLWKRSQAPEWHIELLKIWSEPGDIPEEIWRMANKSSNNNVLFTMASNPSIPEAYKLSLEKNPNIRVRMAAILNEPSISILINKLAEDKNIYIRAQVAKSPNTPKKILMKLAADNSTDKYLNRFLIVEAVASNPSIPWQTLDYIIEKYPINYNNIYIYEALAMNPNVKTEVLKTLAKKNREIQIAIIKNEGIQLSFKQSVIKELYKLDDSFIHSEIALNPATPKDILVNLLDKHNIDNWGRNAIEMGVALNPNTPILILEKLVTKKETDGLGRYYIIHAIASNPSTPKEILENLSKETDIDEFKRYYIIENVASNPSTPKEILEKLAISDLIYKLEGYHILENIASNPNASEKLLISLSNNENALVRLSVAENSNTPLDISLKIFNEIFRNYFINDDSDLTYEIKDFLVKSEKIPIKYLKIFAGDDGEFIRLSALLNLISRPEKDWK